MILSLKLNHTNIYVKQTSKQTLQSLFIPSNLLPSEYFTTASPSALIGQCILMILVPRYYGNIYQPQFLLVTHICRSHHELVLL